MCWFIFPISSLFSPVFPCAEWLLPAAQAAAYRNSPAEQPGRTVPPAELPDTREIPVCLAVQVSLVCLVIPFPSLALLLFFLCAVC